MGNTGKATDYDLSSMISSIKERWGEHERTRGGASPVTVHGGEPLLAKKEDVEEIFKLNYKKFGSGGAIQTNGTLIDDDWIHLFKKYQVGVGISIDGWGTLNAQRVPKGGTLKDALKFTRRTLKNMIRLSKEYRPPGLIIVLSRANATPEKIPHLKRFIVWCAEELNIRDPRLNPGHFDDPWAKQWELANEELAHFWREIVPWGLNRGYRFPAVLDAIDGLVGNGGTATCVKTLCDSIATEAEQPIREDGSAGNCVAAGVAVPTADGDYRCIEDFDDSYGTLIGDSVVVEEKLLRRGKKPVLRLIGSYDREIEVTEDHRVMLDTGEWVEAKDIKQGETLHTSGFLSWCPPDVSDSNIVVGQKDFEDAYFDFADSWSPQFRYGALEYEQAMNSLSPGRNKTYKEISEKTGVTIDTIRRIRRENYVPPRAAFELRFFPLRYNMPETEILARLLGFLITDGCMSAKSGLSHNGLISYFCCVSLDSAKKVCSDLSKLGLSGRIVERPPRSISLRGRNIPMKKMWHVYPRENLLFSILMYALGSPYGRRTTKKYGVPEWIMSAPDRIKWQFLRGIFSGDVGVCVSHGSVKLALQMNGTEETIQSKLLWCEQLEKLLYGLGIHSTVYGPYKRKMESGKYFHRVYIAITNKALFKIDFPYDKYKEEKAQGYRKERKFLVLQKQFLPAKPVFDLSVDHPEHYFFANGVKVHNCEHTIPTHYGVPYLRAEDDQVSDERYQILVNTPWDYGGCKGGPNNQDGKKACRWWAICTASCPGEAIDSNIANRTRFCGSWAVLYEECKKYLKNVFPNIITLDEIAHRHDPMNLYYKVHNSDPPWEAFGYMRKQYTNYPSVHKPGALNQKYRIRDPLDNNLKPQQPSQKPTEAKQTQVGKGKTHSDTPHANERVHQDSDAPASEQYTVTEIEGDG